MATEENDSVRNATSSEVELKNQPSSEKSTLMLQGSEEKTIHLRFLSSNSEAGSIIGKGGSTINDIQSKSGARVQLSRSYEHFPGTSDRIIMVSGIIDDVLKAIELILSKLLDEFYAEEGHQDDPESRIRLVVPNSSCGGLIGKGGATIRSLIEESQASIKISPQDNYYPGLHDRLVTVTGTLTVQMRAIELILLKLAEDQHYQYSANSAYPYGALTYNGMHHGSNGFPGNYQNNRTPVREDRSSSLTIGVADEHVGLVLGRGGRSIMEISQFSGARIKVSDRGDFISGTSDRKVTITGSERAIHVAESMIMEKVGAFAERGLE